VIAASTPGACPVCEGSGPFKATSVKIVDGRILHCSTCGGYLLHPPHQVQYENSGWTAMRREQWDRDARRGRLYADRIRTWYEREVGDTLGSVLEVGCGSAFMGAGFKSLGIPYTGLDVDSASVDFARKQDIDAHAVAVEDLPASSLAGRRYDLVISSNALEHVDSPLRAFEAVRGAMGQRSVIIVPNPEGLLPRLKANRFFLRAIQWILDSDRVTAYSIDGYWHNMAYSRQTLAHLCERVGLEVNELHSIGINDPTFGFVQPNESRLYRIVAAAGGLVDMDSQLLLVARQDVGAAGAARSSSRFESPARKG